MLDRIKASLPSLAPAEQRVGKLVLLDPRTFASLPVTELASQVFLAVAKAVRSAIVDFAAHDREDLRQTHAHARLGFSDAQIEAMLLDSGFVPHATRALAGHELVVKLWTGIRREDSVTQFEPRQLARKT